MTDLERMTILAQFQNCVSKRSIDIISEELKEVPSSKVKKLMNLPFKKPLTTLFLSIFFGQLGVDRFYLKDSLGYLKLALKIVQVMINIVGLIAKSYGNGIVCFLSLAVAVILGLASTLWWIFDIFSLFNQVKKKNTLELAIRISALKEEKE